MIARGWMDVLKSHLSVTCSLYRSNAEWPCASHSKRTRGLSALQVQEHFQPPPASIGNPSASPAAWITAASRLQDFPVQKETCVACVPTHINPSSSSTTSTRLSGKALASHRGTEPEPSCTKQTQACVMSLEKWNSCCPEMHSGLPSR